MGAQGMTPPTLIIPPSDESSVRKGPALAHLHSPACSAIAGTLTAY